MIRIQAFKCAMSTNADSSSVRLLEIGRKPNTNCGFELTRSRWDPYPWVRHVDAAAAAGLAGLRVGDCLLEVNGEDVVGRRISDIATMVRAQPGEVSLLLWNAGAEAHCTPEAVCCGPMPTNLQRLSACMSTILAFLECPVCLDTMPPPSYQCENGHLICIKCRAKSERCPVCRLRFGRGRSLIADQVYSALVDAFDLKGVADNARSKRIREIFKPRPKMAVPDIKITQSATNKLLARLTGKSSSVDNLVQQKGALLGAEFSPMMKAHSTQELFQPASPSVSRVGSVSKLSRNYTTKSLSIDSNSENRPASYHGSFERLPKFDDSFLFDCLAPSVCDFNCPFDLNCTTKINGNELLEHHQNTHDGPIIVYLKPNVSINWNEVVTRMKMTFVLRFEQSVFFTKLELMEEDELKGDNVLAWTWLMGNKINSKEYDMQIEVVNEELNDVIISVRNSICSLHSTSYQDIRNRKKGVMLSTKTFQHFGDIIIRINLLRND